MSSVNFGDFINAWKKSTAEWEKLVEERNVWKKSASEWEKLAVKRSAAMAKLAQEHEKCHAAGVLLQKRLDQQIGISADLRANSAEAIKEVDWWRNKHPQDPRTYEQAKNGTSTPANIGLSWNNPKSAGVASVSRETSPDVAYLKAQVDEQDKRLGSVEELIMHRATDEQFAELKRRIELLENEVADARVDKAPECDDCRANPAEAHYGVKNVCGDCYTKRASAR
jgi:hypothetical protein